MIDATGLRRLRLDRGLSQRQLAASAGVDPLTIKRIEAGADAGDLPLRVLGRLATTLGIPAGQLLREPARCGQATNALAARVGSTLLAAGRVTRTALAAALEVSLDDVTNAIDTLASQLSATGITLCRHADHIWFTPAVAGVADCIDDRPLNLRQARLVRRIHRGEDVRRSLTKTDRELTLPALLRLGLITEEGGRLRVADDVAASLLRPNPRDPA